jgi:hypothetical protein
VKQGEEKEEQWFQIVSVEYLEKGPASLKETHHGFPHLSPVERV